MDILGKPSAENLTSRVMSELQNNSGQNISYWASSFLQASAWHDKLNLFRFDGAWK